MDDFCVESDKNPYDAHKSSVLKEFHISLTEILLSKPDITFCLPNHVVFYTVYIYKWAVVCEAF